MSDITGKDQKKKERLSLFPYLTQSLNAVIVLYVTAKKKNQGTWKHAKSQQAVGHFGES